jgi:hypothetical protein
VHRAHTQGLTTYMSAGFKFDTIQDCLGWMGLGLEGRRF